jgi:hypothetical protein
MFLTHRLLRKRATLEAIGHETGGVLGGTRLLDCWTVNGWWALLVDYAGQSTEIGFPKTHEEYLNVDRIDDVDIVSPIILCQLPHKPLRCELEWTSHGSSDDGSKSGRCCRCVQPGRSYPQSLLLQKEGTAG